MSARRPTFNVPTGDDFTGRPARAKADLGGVGEGEGEKPVKNSTSGGGKGLSKTAQKILRAQKQPPAPTLFLGNLGFETTEGSIRELFEAHRHRGHKDKVKGVDVKAEKQEVTQGEGEGQGGDAANSKDVWIRKIRMGTFEDSGACKGSVSNLASVLPVRTSTDTNDFVPVNFLVCVVCGDDRNQVRVRGLYEHRACYRGPCGSSKSSLERTPPRGRVRISRRCPTGRWGWRPSKFKRRPRPKTQKRDWEDPTKGIRKCAVYQATPTPAYRTAGCGGCRDAGGKGDASFTAA